MSAWYALRVSSHRERSVVASLQRIGLRAWLPVYMERARWSDRIKPAQRLLFPGYVFAHVTLAELAAALPLAGVAFALPDNLRPQSIPDQEIENLKRVLTNIEAKPEPAALVPGDTVTVKSGPMQGATGVLLKTPAGLRFLVAVQMMGRGVAVEIDAADLVRGTCA